MRCWARVSAVFVVAICPLADAPRNVQDTVYKNRPICQQGNLDRYVKDFNLMIQDVTDIVSRLGLSMLSQIAQYDPPQHPMSQSTLYLHIACKGRLHCLFFSGPAID